MAGYDATHTYKEKISELQDADALRRKTCLELDGSSKYLDPSRLCLRKSCLGTSCNKVITAQAICSWD